MLVGERESERYMAAIARKMHSSFFELGHNSEEIILKINPEGEHIESFWGQEFEEAFRWLFPESLNSEQSVLYSLSGNWFQRTFKRI
ncbi:MAG: hypothetical protein AAGA64_18155 [Bacteroidota bacterium]